MIGGEALSPIEVAKRVKATAQSDGWIPGPLQTHVLCPLTVEVRQLYASNGHGETLHTGRGHGSEDDGHRQGRRHWGRIGP